MRRISGPENGSKGSIPDALEGWNGYQQVVCLNSSLSFVEWSHGKLARGLISMAFDWESGNLDCVLDAT